MSDDLPTTPLAPPAFAEVAPAPQLVTPQSVAPAPVLPAPVPPASALRPRTRWAGIVWGLVFAALAAGGIWLASGEGRLDDLATWLRDLSVAAAVGLTILAIGVLLLVTGLVGLLRRAQRALVARRLHNTA